MGYAEKSTAGSFVRKAMKMPILSQEEELDLIRRWKKNGDEVSLHKLITAHIRLVISFASRFRNYGIPYGDLVQEGCMGLMQAAGRFDVQKDVRFSTYASWWVRSTMQDYVLRNWSIVRTGTTSAQKTLFFNLRRLQAERDHISGGLLSREDREGIARELKVKVREVEDMESRFHLADRSLDMPVFEDSGDDGNDFLIDESPSPEEYMDHRKGSALRKKWVVEALDILPDRERRIIAERRLRENGKTLETLGKELGISKERIRQLEDRALTRMKEHLAGKMNDVSDIFYG
jgi:RNA polymerase sigma-32 factor